MTELFGLLSLAFVVSAGLTGLLRRYALMDIPNDRSSHTQPTPRGGGVAIVLVFLAGLPVLYGLGFVTGEVLCGLWLAGALVAVVGFMDDHRHIPARWRLLAHFIAAALGLYGLGGLPTLDFALPFVHSEALLYNLSWLGHGLALLYLVWMLNLYNFMDGIDGLAGVEAISVCTGGAMLYFFGQETAGLHWQPALLALSVAGFLVWNFPPAKIFMGDAGSGFLGLILGLSALQAAGFAPKFFWSWLILLAVFIVDASWTLARRWLNNEKVYEAHRSHAYQKAARRYGAHKPVTLAVAAINVFWLLPLALWVGLGGLNGILGVMIAYAPLVLIVIQFKAGARDAAE